MSDSHPRDVVSLGYNNGHPKTFCRIFKRKREPAKPQRYKRSSLVESWNSICDWLLMCPKC